MQKLSHIENAIAILKQNGIEKITDHSAKTNSHTAFFCQKYGTEIGEKHISQTQGDGCISTLAITGKDKVTISDPFLNTSSLLGLEKMTVQKACMEIHAPSSLDGLQNAQFFLATLEYVTYKHIVGQVNASFAKALKAKSEPNYEMFNFELTQFQVDAVAKIIEFQESENGKLFLLQGDVGCGKTAVAIMATIQAVLAGVQVAVLAPTQILANQLYHTFNESLLKLNIKSVLLTSKDKAKEKKAKLSQVAEGEVSVIIGTHAVFSENVIYKNLGFAIIDEQHKFGVNQRLSLIKKSDNAKCLLMTATPIPRTLAMSMYSGVEYFSIQGKPKNRLPIKTTIMANTKIPEIINSIKTKFTSSNKIYWVCPLVEEESEIKSNIKERQEYLMQHFKEGEVEIVHGKMKEDAINAAILNFKENPMVKILLATTIVEVGIDIKDANVIIIESAETFGLASLHQLRGRVGRGAEQGFCILLYNANGISKLARERLDIMRNSNDGFEIAETDRKMRGSGNILGVNQSGSMKFVFFDEETYYEKIGYMNQVCDSLKQQEKIQIAQFFKKGFFFTETV
jgi:ATP-dependent DNA helicase RecG